MSICVGLYGSYSALTRVREPGAAQLYPARLCACQSVPRARGDHRAFLLCERSEEMQDERVHVGAKFGDDELHALCHQAGDEVNVAAEAIQLGNCYWATAAPSFAEGFCKLRPAVQSVRSLAGLDLDELADDLEAFPCGEASKRLSLCLQAKPGAPLSLWLRRGSR